MALELLDRAIEGVWPAGSSPATRRAEQKLVENDWCPTFAAVQPPQDAQLPITPSGTALAEDLARHCPHLSLGDLLSLALQLRICAADLASQHVETAAHEARVPAVMLDSQQVLELHGGDPATATALSAASLAALNGLMATEWCLQSLRREKRLHQLLEEAETRAVAEKREPSHRLWQ
jgi:hypothetical protein